MRRDVRALAGRAVLLAAGVGAALGVGAGLASAATLPAVPQLPAAPQLPTAPEVGSSSSYGDDVGTLPQAPNLALDQGTTRPRSGAGSSDLVPVSGDQLSALPTNGRLSGLGRGNLAL